MRNTHLQVQSLMKKTILTVLSLSLCLLSACQVVNADQPVPHTPTIQFVDPTPTATQTLVPANISTPTLPPSPEPSLMPTLTSPASGQVTLMAVGDIMLGRTIGELILSEGVTAPFQFTAETLSSADVTVGNLECPITEDGIAEEKTYAFRAPIAAGECLALAGFDVVSLANNHTLDYGAPGLEDTLDTLSTSQVAFVGAGLDASQAYAPVYREINGLRLAFLAFADIPPTDYDYTLWEAGEQKPGIAWAHEARVRESVIQAKENADLVIVLVHNGYEIAQRVSDGQQRIAHLAIDSGASLVIGSHPHVLQRLETYNGGLIAYSMGNFVFDNFLFPPNYSAILSVVLSKDGVESYEMIDVIVQLNGVPQIMEYDLEN